MGNRIWLLNSHTFCKYCKKDVVLHEFYHVRKEDMKSILIRICSICYEKIDYRYLKSEESEGIFSN